MAQGDEVEWIPLKEAASRVGGDLKRTERAIRDRVDNGKNEDGSPLIRKTRETDGYKRILVAWEDVEQWAEGYDVDVSNVLPIPVSVMARLDELNDALRRESNERAALQRIEPFLREQVREKVAAVKTEQEKRELAEQERDAVRIERDELQKQLEERNQRRGWWKFFSAEA